MPDELPDDSLALTASAHWRLLQRIHMPAGGQLTQAMSGLSDSGSAVLRRPSPKVLEIIDPRPLLDQAAQISAAYGGTGLLVAESITAALHYGRTLWFGTERNVGPRTRGIAKDLGISIHVAA